MPGMCADHFDCIFLRLAAPERVVSRNAVLACEVFNISAEGHEQKHLLKVAQLYYIPISLQLGMIPITGENELDNVHFSYITFGSLDSL